MGLHAPNMESVLSSTPFYQNFFSQPVSYTTDVLSQIPQAAGTVENILKADPNLLGYQVTPDYVAALSNYNSLTGGDLNYWKGVTNIDTMQQMNDVQYPLAEAKADYWNTALDPNFVAPDNAKINTFGDLYPVGVYDGSPVQAEFSGTPAYQYYLNDGQIEYSEPDQMDPLAEIFISALGATMGGLFGPVGAGVGGIAGMLAGM